MRSVLALLRTLALWSLAGLAVAPFDALHVATRTVSDRVGGPGLELALFGVAGVVVGALFRFACVPLAARLAHRLAARPAAVDVAHVAHVPAGAHASARNREALRALAAERRSHHVHLAHAHLAPAATVRAHRTDVDASAVDAPESRLRRAFAIGAFAIAYLASSFADHHAPIATTIFAGLALVSLALTPRDRLAAAVVFALAAAVVGPLVEGALSSLGAFDYAHPDLGRVPLWLPALYALLGPAAAALDATFAVSEAKPVVIRRASRDFVRPVWLRTSRRRHV